MTSSYIHEINGTRPKPDQLRREANGRPTVGDLITTGTIVSTSYNTGPYLVDKITAFTVYETYRVWSITGFSRSENGEFERKETNRFWINELVADWSSDLPAIRKLFLANTDEVFIAASLGFAIDRRGQGLLL